jgi:hypothetical protein
VNVIQKVYALMGKKLPKKQGNVPASINLIGTVVKTVEDAETAFREATAARLALAMYKQIKQAFDDDDLGTVATLLNSVKDDDDSAGAALLRVTLLELREKNQRGGVGGFHFINKARMRRRDAAAKSWRELANDLGVDWISAPYPAAEAVAEKISRNGIPSVKTIARAFGAK